MLIYANPFLGGAGYLSAVAPHPEIKTTLKLDDPWDAIMFLGGADVAPELYHDTSPRRMCHSDPAHDGADLMMYRMAKKRKAFMFGICRGAQFLCVMHGGRLAHHLSGHHGPHVIQTPEGQDVANVNSLHHQSCIPGGDVKIEAVYPGVNRAFGKHDEPEDLPYVVEAISGERMFAVQYHPEIMVESSRGVQWFNEQVRKVAGIG